LLPANREKRVIRNTLVNNIGSHWSNFVKNDEYSRDIYILLDGKYYFDLYKIPISDSENIDVLVSVKGYYFDSKGRLTELYLPLVIKTSDGSIFDINNYKKYEPSNVPADTSKLLPTQDELLRNIELVGDEYGKLAVVSLVLDPGQLRGKINPDINNNFIDLFNVYEKYYSYNNSIILDFIDRGVINEKLLFSHVFSGGKYIL
jgi:hypothetical protein